MKNTPYRNLLPRNPFVEHNFKWSLELDSYNPPLQYLYCLYLYDTGKFLKAKSMFSEIDSRYFENLDLNDRAIKIKELILCCKIFLDEISEDEIVKFIGETADQEGDHLWDLVETLKLNAKHYTERIRSALKE
ncbi:hypothetical protein [uncultured Chryseobacterium sp.]|uniref:hypothetical protein n=1 Tax=uncultured Chryseobacterium sp. TaxID=259322 RepID=UPI0025FA4ACC|nr:hypothetical protein [uncultured Chryseobacterium sp.]